MINFDYFDTGTPCIGFCAYSGTGKTSLLERVLKQFRLSGIQAAIVKHTHHDFDIDTPGKDSYRLRKAGALQTLIIGPERWALITEERNEKLNQKRKIDEENTLREAINQLSHNKLDCILIEGYKGLQYPKIELHRFELNKPLMYPDDDSIIALATNKTINATRPLTVLDINNSDEICQFIIKTLNI